MDQSKFKLHCFHPFSAHDIQNYQLFWCENQVVTKLFDLEFPAASGEGSSLYLPSYIAVQESSRRHLSLKGVEIRELKRGV